jgi:hypothetical protein
VLVISPRVTLVLFASGGYMNISCWYKYYGSVCIYIYIYIYIDTHGSAILHPRCKIAFYTNQPNTPSYPTPEPPIPDPTSPLRTHYNTRLDPSSLPTRFFCFPCEREPRAARSDATGEREPVRRGEPNR